MSHRHLPRTPSPLPRLVAGLTCAAVAGIMSMTFFESDWSNPGSVTVVLAIMVFGAAGGAYLLSTGLARLGRLRGQGSLAIETAGETLGLGEAATLRLLLVPARELALAEIGFEAWIEERAEGAEGLGEALVASPLASKVERVSRPIAAGEERRIELPVAVPAAAPGSLELFRHSWALRARVRLVPPAGPVRSDDFVIPVRPRLVAGATPPPAEIPPEPAAGGVALAAPLAAAAGSRLEAGLVFEVAPPAGAMLVPRLVRLVGGVNPEEAVVAEGAPVPAGGAARVGLGLDLPEGLAPSYRGPAFSIEYRLELGCEPEGGLGAGVPAFPVAVRAPTG